MNNSRSAVPKGWGSLWREMKKLQRKGRVTFWSKTRPFICGFRTEKVMIGKTAKRKRPLGKTGCGRSVEGNGQRGRLPRTVGATRRTKKKKKKKLEP